MIPEAPKGFKLPKRLHCIHKSIYIPELYAAEIEKIAGAYDLSFNYVLVHILKNALYPPQEESCKTP